MDDNVAQVTIGGVTYTVVKEIRSEGDLGTELLGHPHDMVSVGIIFAHDDPRDDVVEHLFLPVGERPDTITAAQLLDGWVIRVHGLAHQALPDDNPYTAILRLVGEADTAQELCDWCHDNAVRIFVERLGLGEVL